jgi:hypothetical protein
MSTLLPHHLITPGDQHSAQCFAKIEPVGGLLVRLRISYNLVLVWITTPSELRAPMGPLSLKERYPPPFSGLSIVAVHDLAAQQCTAYACEA